MSSFWHNICIFVTPSHRSLIATGPKAYVRLVRRALRRAGLGKTKQKKKTKNGRGWGPKEAEGQRWKSTVWWGDTGARCSTSQARIQGVGAGSRAHPWGGVSPFKMHYSKAFKDQFITGFPPLGEILYPPLPPLRTTWVDDLVAAPEVMLTDPAAGGAAAVTEKSKLLGELCWPLRLLYWYESHQVYFCS